ncbi:MAG: hypothetical protein WCG73_00090 [Candidatus Moraniibacteriota bacterium]
MRQQDVVMHGSVEPCVIVRGILERTMKFFGIQACAVQKTRKDLESEKGKRIIDSAKVALKQQDIGAAEEFCRMLSQSIDAGGYGDTVWLRREYRKIRNGIDCVKAIEK